MKAKAIMASILISKLAFGQFSETIKTARPGQAIGAFTIGKNVLQFQQGIELNGYLGLKNRPKTYITNHVVRYGVSENIEMSALVDYQSQQLKFDTISSDLTGLSNLHFGFRVHLTDQVGWLPATCFQMRLKMPNVSNEYGASRLAPVMVFVANWSLPQNMSLATNWVLSYNGNNQNPTGKYVLNFGFPVFKKISGFIENYGQVSEGVAESRFDGGFAYLLNNNVQFDLSAGYGQNNAIEDYFISTGISWRIINFRK